MEEIKKEKVILCFKYHSCKLCPRDAKCEKEQKLKEVKICSK